MPFEAWIKTCVLREAFLDDPSLPSCSHQLPQLQNLRAPLRVWTTCSTLNGFWSYFLSLVSWTIGSPRVGLCVCVLVTPQYLTCTCLGQYQHSWTELKPLALGHNPSLSHYPLWAYSFPHWPLKSHQRRAGLTGFNFIQMIDLLRRPIF